MRRGIPSGIAGRESVQHERGMETGKQLNSSAWLAQEIPDEIAGGEI